MAYIPFGILWKFGEAIRNPQSGYGLTVGIISMAYIITVRHRVENGTNYGTRVLHTSCSLMQK